MPPAGKGKGKSRGGSSSTTNRGPSRSRNTTPASATDLASVSDNGTTMGDNVVPSYTDVIQACMPSNDAAIPSSNALGSLQSNLIALMAAAKARVEEAEVEISKWESFKAQKLRNDEQEAKQKGEERERVEKKASDKVKAKEEKERKKKERAASFMSDDSIQRPHAHGAHKPTNQALDNVVVKDEPVEGQTIEKKKKRRSPKDEDEEMSIDPEMKPEDDEDAMESDGDAQPAPIPSVIVYEELEDDPAAYEIGAVTDDTTTEEKKKIYSVAGFPTIDISDLLPGDAPDEDFSRAKPTNQVAMNSFLTYIEPYFRPFNEEDLAFLRERGDRSTPYVLPALGRPYKEVWAEEDGDPLPPISNNLENVAIGRPDDLNDGVLTKPDSISMGPLLSRVLAGMVMEDQPDEQTGATSESKDGDVAMGNANGTNGTTENGTDGTPVSRTSATTLALPEGYINPKEWKVPTNRSEYAHMEERLRQEMIYMGMVNASDTFHFNDRQDDEVSARFRELQTELRDVAVRNGARKARLMELLKEQLAFQEYSTILEDLDKQVDQAYLKRTRGMKAKKKRAGPNGHAVTGAAKSAIGDVARTLMERRKKWQHTIGPVFDDRLTAIPTKTIFDPVIMAGLMQKELSGESVDED